MIERDLQPEDILALLGNATENLKLDVPPNSNINWIASKTWICDDGILGCGGAFQHPNGDYEAWSVINKELAQKYKRKLMVGAKRFLNKTAKENGIKKMIATWKKDFDPKIKWLEHLGFKKTKDTTGDSYIYTRSF